MHALYDLESYYTKSLVHRLDVRTKIIICLFMSVSVMFLKHPISLGLLTILTFIYVLNLGRYKTIFICYITVCVMWVMAVCIMRLMHLIVPMVPITKPLKMLVPFMRTIIMMNTVLVLAFSSRTQALLAALKSLRLPVWLYIPSAVMIRFIPSFIKDIKQIHESMRIRGYDLNFLFMLRHPLIVVRLLAAPLIFRALRSSDDLGVAAELKGVSYGVAISSFKPSFFKKNDVIILIFTFAVVFGACFIQMKFGIDKKGGFM